MGEIKSTLELIMERTRDLTLSEEEKAAFQREEVEKQVRGLLQRYLDRAMDIDHIKREFKSFDKWKQEIARACLKREALQRMDPETDNERLLLLLEQIAETESQKLQACLLQFRKEIKEKKAQAALGILDGLEKTGISGSAVLPNLQADQAWTQYLDGQKQALPERLQNIA